VTGDGFILVFPGCFHTFTTFQALVCPTAFADVAQDQLLTEDEVIAALPPWTTQITARALAVGAVLGAVFSFITMRFSLGPGGVVPTFNMPIGALST
jgi:hypothetical protein